ncbi:MAG: hypothetical protein NTY22_01020 [Proteobacteria bacterium]|nr:hypothetical protein [Pseudomonadota bacterium]
MKVSIIKRPEAFFSELLEVAIKNQKLRISDSAKVYLIDLLSRNVSNNELIGNNPRCPYADKPISIVFQQSLIEPINQRREMLKYVGDYSLYIGGYFNESLNNKIIDVDYYISIGGQAFGNLSKITKSSQTASLYYEIFNKFANLVDIFMEISFDTFITRAEDLIRLYDRWLQTGSNVLERKLMEKGIITVDKKLKPA